MQNPFDNITHIIFDLDGLLIDSEPLWKIAEDVILNAYNTEWDAEKARHHIGLRIDEVASVMVKLYELPLTPDDMANQLMKEMTSLVNERLETMPGADEAIRTLHESRFTLAIASSSGAEYIQAIVKKMDWGKHISVIASAEHVERGKPAPDVYLLAAELLKVNPVQCLALEDSLNGAKAAHTAGMRVIAIPGHDFSASDFDGIADYIFPSLPEFLQQLPH